MTNSVESVSLADAALKRSPSASWLSGWVARWRTDARPSPHPESAPGYGHAQTLTPVAAPPEVLPGAPRHGAPHGMSHPADIDDASAMQLVRAQLMLRWFKPAKRRVIAIANTHAHGAEPSIAARLATACANVGDRTLLIDANLRGPALLPIHAAANRSGLSSVLTGEADFADAIVPGPVERLSILPGGTPVARPEGLFGRGAMMQIIDRAENDFDVVLIDTPRLTRYADALIVADVVGGVLVTVRRHATRAATLGHAAWQLRSLGVTIVGAVFTDI